MAGYCYLAWVRLNGQWVEALRLTNCRIRPGDTGDDDGDTVMYEVVGVPARVTPPSNSSEPVLDNSGSAGRMFG